MESCPGPHTVLSIPYVRQYFCAKPAARPTIFVGLILWLVFLFSTLGISASDFFCPNLGTLAHLLGLDENVAGVTFLAFGNGSPDVFSTFSAMRSNSGGLAIGELLGAAAFVTSCVVGSMCIIKPFKVNRGPFLRDVGFFTVAVTVLLVVLWDSKLVFWEAISLIGLYVFYVAVVVIASWLDRRRERNRQREEMMRDEYREDSHAPFVEPYRDDRKWLGYVQSSILKYQYSELRTFHRRIYPRSALSAEPCAVRTSSTPPRNPITCPPSHARMLATLRTLPCFHITRVDTPPEPHALLLTHRCPRIPPRSHVAAGIVCRLQAEPV